MNDLSLILPDSSHLKLLLPERYSKEIEALINRNLILPVADFFQHPGKNLRPLLVQLGYRLSFEDEPELTPEILERLDQASAIVEMIHSGSLIVDDIQDDSSERRNAPTLHMKHGLPLALNAGNWLYFRALCLVKNLGLDSLSALELLDDLIDLMGKAHMGQAIDLGTKISELPLSQIKSTCLTSMELKTGTLLALALRLGMAIAGRTAQRPLLMELGHKMGLALQMYDDLGNYCTENGKQYEDIINQRPTWVWAQASELGEEAFKEFILCAQSLPEPTSITNWNEIHGFVSILQSETQAFLTEISNEWSGRWHATHPESMKILNYFKIILESSYVKKT